MLLSKKSTATSTLYVLFLTSIVFISIPCRVSAQTSSGEISGRVVDSSEAVVRGATVLLANESTGEHRTTETEDGRFVFVAVLPGTYSVSVRASGFKAFDKHGLHLSASERLSAGTLTLEIGSVAETVSVHAPPTTVQTESAERSALLDSNEISGLMTPGRDVLSLVRLLPGVVKDGEGNEQLGTEGAGSVSGSREVSNNISVDGINGNPRGGGNRFDTPLNMEAVGEVKVLLNSYQAEYGQSSGAVVNLVTKSGTQVFHGEAYYYGRNDAFNANDTFNNHTGKARPLYRYNTVGYNIGGPIYWPGKFNPGKNKLFFFFSQEIWPTKTPGTAKYFMMPTQLERQGDFSKSVDFNGDPVVLRDPKNCGPAANQNCLLTPTQVNPAFINPNTQTLMNILPLPNLSTAQLAPSGGLYNYFIQMTTDRPVDQQVLRLDYDVTDKWRMFFRGMNMSNNQRGNNVSGVPSAMQWGIPFYYDTPARNVALDLTFTASPTLVNEFTAGYGDWREFTGLVHASDLAKLQRDKLGIALGQFSPASNPLNLVPRATFGGGGTNAVSGWGIKNAPEINFDNRFPFNNNTGTWELTDGLTKLLSRHTMKAGIYFQKGRYVQHPIGNIFDGQFKFDINAKNTNDALYAYANALLGNYNNYTEGNRTVYAPKWKILEWYVQDNWKLTPKLTLDYGARLSYDFPTTLDRGAGATFVPSRYDPVQAPALYQPILYSSLTKQAQKAACNFNQGGSGKCGQNPNTPSDIQPSAAIGQFVSAFNFTGTVVNTDPTYPRALRNSNGVLAAPRFGLAWDPFGDGKTSVRLGAGLFYNLREDGGVVGDYSTTAPVIGSETVNYGNASTFLPGCNSLPRGCAGAGGLLLGPQDTKVMPINHKIASVINANFGIERNIGFATVVDVSYVGTFGRHLEQTPNINEVRYLSQFAPQNLDPTMKATTYLSQTPNPVTQQGAKDDNFFRPVPGYANIDVRDYTSTSNYNSLQTSVNRRFTKDLQFGVSYTWSKAMDYVDNTGGTGTFGSHITGGTGGAVAIYQNARWWNYGLASYDRTHNLVFHWLYNLPKASRLWNNQVVKGVADNWEWSGIAQFVSGTPQSYSYGQSTSKITLSTGGLNITGGGDGARLLLFGDPLAPASQHRSSFQFLNASVFALPPVGVIPNPGEPGMTRSVVYRGPGTNTWDMALAKNIPIKERVRLQLRCEAYNVFNHVSFNAVQNTATFDSQTGLLVPSAGFGSLTADRGARILQLVGKISF